MVKATSPNKKEKLPQVTKVAFGKKAENMKKVSLSRGATELGPINLCVSNLSYAKAHREDEFILKDINFFAPRKSLTVITGPVGSGKCTVLSAIAGEHDDAEMCKKIHPLPNEARILTMFPISYLLVQARGKRKSNVNGESRAKGRAGVFLLAFALYLSPLAWKR